MGPKKDAPNKSANTMSFPFDKLPPELKNEIYELALTTDAPIKVISGGDATASCSTLLRVGRRKRRVPVSDTIAWGLLRANKATHIESTPFLYGFNRFEFSSLQALGLFVKPNRRNGELLTHVKILAIPWDGIKEPRQANRLALLTTLKRPERLSVDVGSLYDPVYTLADVTCLAQNVAVSVAPFARHGTVAPHKQYDHLGNLINPSEKELAKQTRLQRISTIEVHSTPQRYRPYLEKAKGSFTGNFGQDEYDKIFSGLVQQQLRERLKIST